MQLEVVRNMFCAGAGASTNTPVFQIGGSDNSVAVTATLVQGFYASGAAAVLDLQGSTDGVSWENVHAGLCNLNATSAGYPDQDIQVQDTGLSYDLYRFRVTTGSSTGTACIVNISITSKRL